MKNSKCKLVHIEDNEDEVHIFQLLMKGEGLELAMVRYPDGRSGFEFLSALRNSEHPGNILVILDLNLPDMSGMDILKGLQQDQLIKSIPIIVFSGSENPQDRKQCLEFGVRGFHVKPWDVQGYIEFINGPVRSMLVSLT
jgi:CheY-like chemotaxis protein